MALIVKVADMTCNHCKMTIEKVVSEVQQVRSVAVDLDNHLVTVDGDMAIDQVIQAIKDAGYTPGDVMPAD